MILAVVQSIDGVTIRLTEERWYEHIVFNRPHMSGYMESVLKAVENPQIVLRGHRKSKVAVVNFGAKRWLHVVYRELSKTDGFIVTAKFEDEYNENLIIWKQEF